MLCYSTNGEKNILSLNAKYEEDFFMQIENRIYLVNKLLIVLLALWSIIKTVYMSLKEVTNTLITKTNCLLTARRFVIGSILDGTHGAQF